mmetsp:Transcript_6904/g.24378  ORF Transcript_6904/g.24378 Transcript_6904/m.24378 type:complete len:228 (-) Transcript_6904:4-687(-)
MHTDRHLLLKQLSSWKRWQYWQKRPRVSPQPTTLTDDARRWVMHTQPRSPRVRGAPHFCTWHVRPFLLVADLFKMRSSRLRLIPLRHTVSGCSWKSSGGCSLLQYWHHRIRCTPPPGSCSTATFFPPFMCVSQMGAREPTVSGALHPSTAHNAPSAAAPPAPGSVPSPSPDCAITRPVPSYSHSPSVPSTGMIPGATTGAAMAAGSGAARLPAAPAAPAISPTAPTC